MMDRRSVLTFGALGLCLAALDARAQTKPFRVAVIRPGLRPRDAAGSFSGTFKKELQELGFVEGQNLVLDYHFAERDLSRLPAIVSAMIEARTDVAIAVGGSAARAVLDNAPDMPVVMFANLDPVAHGLIAGLSRPGGNLTGVLIAPGGTLAGKRLEILVDVVPNARRVALLAPDDPAFTLQIEETSKAAVARNVELLTITVRRAQYDAAFEAAAGWKADAMIVGAHQFFVADRHAIIALADRYRLPAMYEWEEQVRDGGLMSYGSILEERYRAVASYVARILRGVHPSTLPVEQPTQVQLALNLKTARALGLAIPQSILLRADTVIE
jgi:putative ABC transport system substrate-binding protein